jgi:DNA-directed RNA polymerase
LNGETEKKPWDDRRRWVREHFADWRDVDKPFAFVAACMELSRAKKDPQGFITHLPISFDGTWNGIQHLALLSRDEEAGRLVNLTDCATPQDVYDVVAKHILWLLQKEDRRLRSDNKKIDDAWCYGWWRERLASLNDKQRRNITKYGKVESIRDTV